MRQYSIAFLACVALGLPGFGTTALAQGTAPAPAPVRVNAGLPSAGGQNIAAGASSEQPAPQPMFAMRGGRPVITLADGNFTMQPVLRLDADAGGFWDQPFYPGNRPRQLGSEGPGVPDPLMNVRRARLGVQGTFLKDFTYNFTWEFAPGPGRQFDPGVNSRIFELQAAYTGFKNTVIRVGGFTLNYTLEFATSSFETLMMERPAIVNIAASLAAGDTRLAQGIETRGENWFLSAYFSQNVLSTLNDGDARGLVARAVYMPVNTDRFKLAVGFNPSAQFHPGLSPGQNLRLRDYPEIRLEPTRLLDTGTMRNINNAYAIGGEVSGMVGPVMFASEYYQVPIQGINGAASASFRGWYANVAVPLVGGARRWDASRAAWTRPRFKELNTAEPGALGFAELVARYSYVNLYDTPYSGNSQSITSVALNYYPLQRVRFTLEYANGTIRIPGPDRAFQAMAGRISFNW